MTRSLDQIRDELKPTLDAGDNGQVAKILGELIGYTESNRPDVEAMLGWGILVAVESGLPCAGEYGCWFMEQFPDSVLPVKIEFAEHLAGQGRYDDATRLAREYVRLITDSGHIDDLEEFANVRAGASKAFLLLTAAYTETGARSYSQRILNFASQFRLLPAFEARFEEEIHRLQDELIDDEHRERDEMWENFFRTGSHADELYKHCQKLGCPILARRVDLLEANFRFQSNFALDTAEILQLVVDAESDSRPAQLLV